MIQFLLLLIIAVFAGLLLHGLHRKIIARIQSRPGPPVWQEILHTLKFSFKQTWIPKTASQVMYVAIVLIAVGIWIAALWVVWSGASLLILFALYMLHKIIEHGTGLSSGSPYTKFGAIRSVMSAAAELPLLATVAIVYLFWGTLSIGEIAQLQIATHTPTILIAFPAAVSLTSSSSPKHTTAPSPSLKQKNSSPATGPNTSAAGVPSSTSPWASKPSSYSPPSSCSSSVPSPGGCSSSS